MQIISEVHLQKAVKTDNLEIDVTTISKFINMNAACSERGWNKIMYAEQYLSEEVKFKMPQKSRKSPKVLFYQDHSRNPPT